jgi:hypothetical protein
MECCRDFAEVFDPIIQDYHGISKDAVHNSDMDVTKIKVCGMKLKTFLTSQLLDPDPEVDLDLNPDLDPSFQEKPRNDV